MNAPEIDLSRYEAIVNRIQPIRMEGEVVELVGLLIESRGPAAALGEFCEVRKRDGRVFRTQVVGFRNGRVLSMPLEETGGVCLGDRIIARGGQSGVEVSSGLLGRVLNGFGTPMDDGPPIHADACRPIEGTPTSPLRRA
ncbi:MAG: flagellum-specific ATP synthase FliI, partial [Terriglobia bacterium]